MDATIHEVMHILLLRYLAVAKYDESTAVDRHCQWMVDIVPSSWLFCAEAWSCFLLTIF